MTAPAPDGRRWQPIDQWFAEREAAKLLRDVRAYGGAHRGRRGEDDSVHEVLRDFGVPPAG